MLVPWTPLQPSARARHLRRAAACIALASASALLAAALHAAPVDARLFALAIVAGVAVVAVLPDRTDRGLEIGVSSLGGVMVRSRDPADADAAPSHLARIVFAAPWLISLRSGTMLIPIWPDSLPLSTYRRLWVHHRWGRAIPSDDDRRPIPATHADSMDS